MDENSPIALYQMKCTPTGEFIQEKYLCKQFNSDIEPSPAVVIDEDIRLDKSELSIPRFYLPYISYGLISETQLKERTHQLAVEVYNHYRTSSTPLTFICTLKGACRFFDRFTSEFRKIHLADSNAPNRPAYREEYLSVSSYQGTASTNNVKINRDNFDELRDHNVVVFEDVLDTGRTLKAVSDFIQKSGVASLSSCILLEKRIESETEMILSSLHEIWRGFSIPNLFVVGFGIDYNQMFRDVDHICVVNEEGVKAFAYPPRHAS